ncbi:hypothetical protein M011DRAFT_472711 [Sporormia fimetaria CBS 119925]|uniref:Uncharacterized protein n=1 Tax=Sporormia fimetaria CBS 119925 TaxID=1340428 RepID=A0A6A6UXR8_9PLEO|nr:hypothetical protein M011DRAFT_472711 [Sporormia fimetaria CBS 119925]
MSQNFTSIPLHNARSAHDFLPRENYPTALPPRQKAPFRLSTALKNRKVRFFLGTLVAIILIIGGGGLGFWLGKTAVKSVGRGDRTIDVTETVTVTERPTMGFEPPVLATEIDDEEGGATPVLPVGVVATATARVTDVGSGV